jgi:hypothetical protein
VGPERRDDSSADDHAPVRPSVANERALYLGVFVVSMAVLVLEIALTRIFSFTIWYHFAYVTVSVALLGFGASGALLAAFPGLAGRATGRRLATYALACGLSIVAALLVFAWLPFSAFGLVRDPVRQLPLLVVFYVAVTGPFLLAGLCIAVALAAVSHQVARLYFSDLAGAGAGCLVAVPLIAGLTTPGAVIAAAFLMSVAGVCFIRADGRGRVAPALAGAAIVGLAGLGALTVADFKPAPEKSLAPFLADLANIRVYGHEWSPIFRTDVFGWKDEEVSRAGGYAGWGLSPSWRKEAATRAPTLRFITHDGDAGAPLYAFDGDLTKLELFDHLVLKTPYVLLRHPDVLVIGVGGGADIVNALKHGATHVTGIELDPVTVRQVAVDQAAFVGNLYARPDVRVIVGEGRSTLRRSNATYDLIQLSEVDTFAALTTGAYVTSESYLYTTDAIHDFLDHLKPDGLLSVAVVDLSGGAAGYPRHTMRQVALYVEALRQRGIADPENRIAVVASTEGWPVVEVVLKNGLFSPDEAAELRGFAAREGFPIWALPYERYATPHSAYLRTPPAERNQFLARQELVVTPISDDDPFFFNFYRWRNLGRKLGELDPGHTLATAQIVLALILLLAVGASAVLIVLPLLTFRRHGLATTGTWGFIAFFFAIGIGFAFIEISVVQRFILFLGYPTYSLTVVLFALLTSSGVGSFLTGRMRAAPETRLGPMLAALVAVLLFYVTGAPWLIGAFLGTAFGVRVAITGLVLLPMGLVMGTFFPTGIQLARRADPALIPWAWGMNGCAAVVGSVLAVMLAMALGFRAVTYLALAIYLVGVLALRAATSRGTLDQVGS